MSLPISKLIDAYKTDPDSTFHALRFHSRQNYSSLMTRLDRDCGSTAIAEINARLLRRLHEGWVGADNHVAMAHGLVGMLRTLCTFGSTILEDADCTRLSAVLSKLRFKMPKPRTERITAQQAIAVIEKAHALGFPSVAFAQALQFDLMLRQKDVIGEWVPEGEPGQGIVTADGMKWLRGIVWAEIDTNLILRHVTSKRQKEIEIDLKLAPLVMAELTRILESGVTPKPGALVVSEATGLPYYSYSFRRLWRLVATAAGVPLTTFNMDSRAGAITEATEAGADLEHIKHAATHSDIAMTQRYARGAVDKTRGVMEKRAEHRAKNTEVAA